jgi:hypothetical protein
MADKYGRVDEKENKKENEKENKGPKRIKNQFRF